MLEIRELTPKLKAEIDAMSQEDMMRLWRFAPLGSPYFAGEVGDYFKASFDSKGGITPSVSKSGGWDKPSPSA